MSMTTSYSTGPLLKADVLSGKVTDATIDTSVSRILTQTFNFEYEKEYRKGSVPEQKYETLDSVKDHAPFTEGETVWIRGILIDKYRTTVSSGTIADITYKLVDAPPGFFLSPDNTAEIFGYLSMGGSSAEKVEYNVKLFAVDANSVEFLVDYFPLTVQKKGSQKKGSKGVIVGVVVALVAVVGVVGAIMTRRNSVSLTISADRYAAVNNEDMSGDDEDVLGGL